MDRFKVVSITFFCFVLVILSSCASWNFFNSKGTETEISASNEIYQRDEALLLKWQTQTDARNYTQVIEEIAAFLKENPASPHWYAILFTYGSAREGIEDWSGAKAVYQQIIERSTDRQMEFVALAYYRMANCHEVLLENDKALAALTDAGNLQAYLPLEVALSELPARIAAIHARLNQPLVADLYSKKAEKGISRLRATKRNSDPDWMSRTLLKMGSINLNQLDAESFKQNLLTLQRNQRYLLQAIELDRPNFAKTARQQLLSTYTNLWAFIESYEQPATSDWEADLVNTASTKAEFLSWYLESIENLKSYQSPEDSSAYKNTQATFKQVADLENRAATLLHEELLKRPWHLNPASLIQKPSGRMKSSKATDLSELEGLTRPSHIPSQLPKKKSQQR